MKKKLLVTVLAVLLCLSMALMAGCGKSEDKKSEQASSGSAAAATQEAEKQEEAEKPAEKPEEKPAEKTLEQYFADNPEQLTSMKEELNKEGTTGGVMDIDVTVEGNVLSYIYKFKTTYSAEQVKAMKATLEATMTEDSEAVKQIKSGVGLMEQGIGIKGIQVKLIYQNGDGTVMAETTVES